MTKRTAVLFRGQPTLGVAPEHDPLANDGPPERALLRVQVVRSAEEIAAGAQNHHHDFKVDRRAEPARRKRHLAMWESKNFAMIAYASRDSGISEL